MATPRTASWAGSRSCWMATMIVASVNVVRKKAIVMVSKVATTPHSTSAATTHFTFRFPASRRTPQTGPSGSREEGGAPREAPQQEQRGDGRRQVGGPEEVVLHVREVVRQEGVEQRRGPGGDGPEPQVAEHGERDHHQQPEPHQVVEVENASPGVWVIIVKSLMMPSCRFSPAFG